MRAHYLPLGRSQTLAVITTKDSPVPGCPASTPTAAHTPTATTPTLPPPTPPSPLKRLQSQGITDGDNFLSTLKPSTSVNIDLLEFYLKGPPR